LREDDNVGLGVREEGEGVREEDEILPCEGTPFALRALMAPIASAE
jgi:hypothetical protein